MAQDDEIKVAVANTVPGVGAVIDIVEGIAAAVDDQIAGMQVADLMAQNAHTMAELQATAEVQQAEIMATLEQSGVQLPEGMMGAPGAAPGEAGGDTYTYD